VFIQRQAERKSWRRIEVRVAPLESRRRAAPRRGPTARRDADIESNQLATKIEPDIDKRRSIDDPNEFSRNSELLRFRKRRACGTNPRAACFQPLQACRNRQVRNLRGSGLRARARAKLRGSIRPLTIRVIIFQRSAIDAGCNRIRGAASDFLASGSHPNTRPRFRYPEAQQSRTCSTTKKKSSALGYLPVFATGSGLIAPRVRTDESYPRLDAEKSMPGGSRNRPQRPSRMDCPNDHHGSYPRGSGVSKQGRETAPRRGRLRGAKNRGAASAPIHYQG